MPDLDPSFPHLHVRPARGWVNDPNGLCRVDGRWHVFYQHNASAPRHGDIDWGHASSADLLHWTDEPVALRHRPGGVDGGGCWSGCVVDDDGVPTAVYSAVGEGEDGAERAQVVLARSDRTLRDWVQDEVAVVGPSTDSVVPQVRDPYVFTHEGRRYAVLGAGRPGGRARLLLYGCDDLTDWIPLGPLLTDRDPVADELAPADIWECPNLVRLDGRWLLVVSLWRWVRGSHLLAGVRYLVGGLQPDGDGLRFVTVAGGLVDAGPSFYAPQLLAMAEPGGPQRVLRWSWAWERGQSEEQLERRGGAGALTFPRELTLDGNLLVSRPARELVGLRRAELAWRPREGFRAAAFEVVATGPCRLYLRRPGADLLVVDLA